MGDPPGLMSPIYPQHVHLLGWIWYINSLPVTGPRSAVSNMSGCRYLSDCRSRGHESDPGTVLYYRGDWSGNNFYGHSPPFCWFKKDWCQLQVKVFARSTGKLLNQTCPGKSVFRWTDRPNMTIAVDWDVKNQTKPRQRKTTKKSSVGSY